MKPVYIIISVLSLAACQQAPSQKDNPAMKAIQHVDSSKMKYTTAMVDNLRDPSCGMPVAAGLEDTLHYKGKIYGFCSDECRDEFKKDPEAHVKTAVMKK